MNLADNPLRRLRQRICSNRADFSRRYGVNYQTVSAAELGLINKPVNFVRVLAEISGQEPAEIMQKYAEWRNEGIFQ